MKFSDKFEFRKVNSEEVAVKIRQFNPRKVSPVDCIPAKILMQTFDVFSVAIHKLFNSGLSKDTVPKEYKVNSKINLHKFIYRVFDYAFILYLVSS